MGILEILFSLFILSLPIGEIGRFQFGSVSFSINDIFLSLTVIFWLIKKLLSKNKSNFKFKLLKPVSVFICIGLISLISNFKFLNNLSFIVSFLYLVRFVLYFLIYIIIFDFTKSFKNKILYMLAFSSIIIMSIGFVQFIFYPNLRNLYYLGWDEHLYRLFSSLLDPNFAGIILVLSFVLLLGLAISFFRKSENKLFYIFLALSLINFYEIYLTYSRSALTMLVVSMSVFLLLLGKKKITLVVLLLLIATIFVIPNSFKTEGTNFFRTASSAARLGSMKNAITIIKDNPILGVGFNSYRYAQHRYGFLTGNAWETTHAGAGLDNSFIFVLVTTGFVGFIAYLYTLFSIFKIAITKKGSLNSIILISSILGLIASGLFINSLFYIFVMEWVWILTGITESS